MAFVSAEQFQEHLALTDDMYSLDETLVTRKLAAAQNHVERLLGYRLITRFIDTDDAPVVDDEREDFPDSVGEAILQLAAWWFENREAAGPAMREMPFGVRELLSEYRDWTF